MTKYQIAHIREQDQDMIIIQLASTFDLKPQKEQLKIKDALQICATSAKLAGIVVPVWLDSSGSDYKFIAPEKWHAYFRTIGWNRITAMRNKTLTCN